jgi:CRP/FNR family transcriptional regulator, cyclic AMP receptor protein
MADLAGPSLLEILSQADCDWLAAQGRRRAFADGGVLHERGDTDPLMVIVISGRVRLVRLRSTGQEGIASTVSAGQHFADVLMFGRRARTHRAVAQGATEVDFYDRAAFAQIMDRPAIVRALYQVTAERLVGAMNMLDDVRNLSREAHLGKLLLHLDRQRTGAEIVCVQEDLAGLLGVTTMTVAKSLRQLRERGLIETGYRKVRVLDRANLRAWLTSQD